MSPPKCIHTSSEDILARTRRWQSVDFLLHVLGCRFTARSEHQAQRQSKVHSAYDCNKSKGWLMSTPNDIASL